MKTFKVLTLSLLVVALGAMLVSMTPQQQKMPEPWEVPAKYKNMENPVANDAASQQKGMVVYKKYCASCHGKAGLGDGVKARALKTFSGDFSIDQYQGQTDGEHFYKTKFGRGEMPKYENKVPDTDIWHCVNYMRTFKK
ncbi:MAG: c-type cytochrome [Marinilabiliaceae bacterium]|jgi:mono/diheme cytochrome c family protein|nr:c-type cytochrome [Marinilabiliaceae bacterium]